jgi:hypothetical protein
MASVKRCQAYPVARTGMTIGRIGFLPLPFRKGVFADVTGQVLDDSDTARACFLKRFSIKS